MGYARFGVQYLETQITGAPVNSTISGSVFHRGKHGETHR